MLCGTLDAQHASYHVPSAHVIASPYRCLLGYRRNDIQPFIRPVYVSAYSVKRRAIRSSPSSSGVFAIPSRAFRFRNSLVERHPSGSTVARSSLHRLRTIQATYSATPYTCEWARFVIGGVLCQGSFGGDTSTFSEWAARSRGILARLSGDSGDTRAGIPH